MYQIFTGKLADGVLSDVKWGKNGTGTEGTAVESTVLEALMAVNGKSDTEKLAVITDYANLNEGNKFGTVTNGSPLDVPTGYYLIKDVDGVFAGKDEVYTTYIVEDVTINPKADKTTSDKTVTDVEDSTGKTESGQLGADFDIGDKVPFELKATIGDGYEDYKSYKLVFHDTLSESLSFNTDSVVVKLNGTEITTGYYIVNENTNDGCTFEVVFDNLKNVPGVASGSVITVEYTAELRENAVIGGHGNMNKLHVEYSNNPNEGHETETGNTPEDIVVVFTYKVTVNKVDEKGEPLTGAEFTLEKLIKGENGATDTWKPITVVNNNAGTGFTFSGLDDGQYRLSETKTPDTYNSIEPIYFTISASHDGSKIVTLIGDQTSQSSTKLEGDTITAAFTSSTTDGSLSTNVENNKGATLPETGGVGTTLFYVIGGILMVGAIVLLIAKKRMNAE